MAVKDSPKKDVVERKGANHPVFYAFSVVILVIIVVTFIGAPVVGGIGGPGRIVFGYYGNEPIDFVPGNYFSNQKDALAEQVRASADSGNLEFQIFSVWRGAFDRTVIHTAIASKAAASGLVLSSDYLDRALTRHPRYMENGEFSEARYNAVPNSERFNIRNYTRESLLYRSFLTDYFSTRIPAAEIGFLKSMASPERKFRYAIFSVSDYPDSAVRDYALQRADKFQKIKLSSLTVTSGRSDAERILAQARSGTASFEELVQTHSRDAFADQGGDMGWKFFHEIEPTIRNPEDMRSIFALGRGELSNLIETQNGWAFFRCDEPAVAPDFNDAEILSAARSYMNTYDRGLIEDWLIGQARAFRTEALAEGFVSVAARGGIDFGETDYFPINYGNTFFMKQVSRENDILASAAFREPFFETAFALDRDEISEPITLREAVVVLQMLDEREADASEFSLLEGYYPLILRQFQEEDLQRFIMGSPMLRDNFNEVFFEHFLPGE